MRVLVLRYRRWSNPLLPEIQHLGKFLLLAPWNPVSPCRRPPTDATDARHLIIGVWGSQGLQPEYGMAAFRAIQSKERENEHYRPVVAADPLNTRFCNLAE